MHVHAQTATLIALVLRLRLNDTAVRQQYREASCCLTCCSLFFYYCCCTNSPGWQKPVQSSERVTAVRYCVQTDSIGFVAVIRGTIEQLIHVLREANALHCCGCLRRKKTKQKRSTPVLLYTSKYSVLPYTAVVMYDLVLQKSTS